MTDAGITVHVSGTRLSVDSPYHPTMVAGARRLNGKFTDGTWVFDARDEERVRALLWAVYGTDGTDVAAVTVRIDVALWYFVDVVGDNRTLYFAGRKIAERRERDSRVRLGEGVVLVEGSFPSSGGSRANPRLDVESFKPGQLVLEVRDVPAGHDNLAEYGKDQGVTVVADDQERSALREERAALAARIAAIDKLLGED